MNVLLVAKLSDPTLSENVLLPILASNTVKHIFVLRDRASEIKDSRVSYHSPKLKGLSRHIEKIKLGVELCRKNKIDAIVGVLNTPHGYIGKLISKMCGIPYIHMTIAGYREFWASGKCMEVINLRLFKNSIVTVTGEQTKGYLLSKGYDPSKVIVLSNLPNSLYNETLVLANNRQYDIVSLSRIDKNKNISLLIKAVAKLRDIKPRVLIVGDGSELPNLISLVNELSLNDQVLFTGYLSDLQHKIGAYSDSKIFVSCSKGEGFPVSLLEAMCCGCVPVVSNAGDCVDVVKDASNGYVFNNTDSEDELTDILRMLLNEPRNIDRVRLMTVKIKEHISVKKNGEIWNNILKSVISRDV